MRADLIDTRVPLIWTVDNVLTAHECEALIARIEEGKPAPAPIATARGFVMRPDIRNNTRVILDDAALAGMLFDRVRGKVPPRAFGMDVAGANERLRCYKYEPGQRFAPHFDGAFERNPQERSWFTFMVYLNDGFGGGETDFPDSNVKIAPKAGTALLFQHHQLHEGCSVTSGVKYVVRSDLMYRGVQREDWNE